MRIIICFLSLVLFCGCQTSQIQTNSAQTDNFLLGIETSVKEYYSKERPSEHVGDPQKPPYKVFGISINQKFEDIYVIGADVEKPDGQRFTETVIARKFTTDGKIYFKTQPYNQRLIDSLKIPYNY